MPRRVTPRDPEQPQMGLAPVQTCPTRPTPWGKLLGMTKVEVYLFGGEREFQCDCGCGHSSGAEGEGATHRGRSGDPVSGIACHARLRTARLTRDRQRAL